MTEISDTNFDEIIYHKLKNIANKLMSQERLNHTLSPTDLVHEAYLKLSTSNSADVDSNQYLFILARQMRRLLVDYGRQKSATKNGGSHDKILYTDALGISKNSSIDFSIISEAIDELELMNKRCALAIDLYYFTAISRKETAQVLNISMATLERDLRFAKAHISQFVDEHSQVK